jgi:hypothetical protein
LSCVLNPNKVGNANFETTNLSYPSFSTIHISLLDEIQKKNPFFPTQKLLSMPIGSHNEGGVDLQEQDKIRRWHFRQICNCTCPSQSMGLFVTKINFRGYRSTYIMDRQRSPCLEEFGKQVSHGDVFNKVILISLITSPN